MTAQGSCGEAQSVVLCLVSSVLLYNSSHCVESDCSRRCSKEPTKLRNK